MDSYSYPNDIAGHFRRPTGRSGDLRRSAGRQRSKGRLAFELESRVVNRDRIALSIEDAHERKSRGGRIDSYRKGDLAVRDGAVIVAASFGAGETLRRRHRSRLTLSAAA